MTASALANGIGGTSKLNILFVNLDWSGLLSKKTHKIHFELPPLDLILLSNLAANAGHEVKILDLFIEPMDFATLKSSPLVAEADWILITTTPYHMWQCPNADWEFIKKALVNFPAQKSVLIGLHGSIFPEQTLRETGVHAVIRREPEPVFKDFLTKGSWEKCAGVCFLEGGTKLVDKGYAILPPLDELVVSDYCVDIEKYSYFLLGEKTGVFEASRGCPWKCTFCDQEMFSWKYRKKSPQIFAAEVARGIEQTGMKTAYFFDLEFTVHKQRTLEICAALIEKGVHLKIKWACQTRADTVDEEILDALKNAGCCLIHFGVESANPDVLEATDKKITLPQIEKGVRLAKAKGFQTACFFMYGLPDESSKQFDNTLEFARELNPTYASFHFAIPFPGTPLYDRYLKDRSGRFGDWPGPYFTEWKSSEIRNYVKRSFAKFYLTPKKFEIQEFRFRLKNLGPKLKYFRSMV